jgi:hypothetical protein
MLSIINHEPQLGIYGKEYALVIDKLKKTCCIRLKDSGTIVFEFDIYSTVDSTDIFELPTGLELEEMTEGETICVKFRSLSNIWSEMYYIMECSYNFIRYYCRFKGDNRRLDKVNFFLKDGIQKSGARAGFEAVYVPRFDWKAGKVIITPADSDSLGCQQWLSPPPFCYALKLEETWISCGIAVKQGEYNFLSYDYIGGDSFYLSLSYEGHTIVENVFETPHIILLFGNKSENDAVKAYTGFLSDNGYINLQYKHIPAWWRQPIFCGWGQQRYDYRRDHDGHENGNFRNVGDYSSEETYRMYDAIMKTRAIDPGTIIIDFNWAEQCALAEPSPRKWRNMRSYIDEQHENGRRVLLWYAPTLAEGLPEEACMKLDDRIVASDPTSPVYKRIITEEIRKMISAEQGCLNADGFKIDFTQTIPSEHGAYRNFLNTAWGVLSDDERHMYRPLKERGSFIETYERKWGVEILKEYISTIYYRMKEVKQDSMLVTHTANPYFADVVDVLRLNDLDGTSEDVLVIMKNRAEIATLCNPCWLIDTDNDLMVNRDMWRRYIELQPQLGIPDTYYISGLAMSGEQFEDEDYELLRIVWQEYRKSLDY